MIIRKLSKCTLSRKLYHMLASLGVAHLHAWQSIDIVQSCLLYLIMVLLDKKVGKAKFEYGCIEGHYLFSGVATRFGWNTCI
jgi:hypothetical protein